MRETRGCEQPPARCGGPPLLAESAVHHYTLLTSGCEPLQCGVHLVVVLKLLGRNVDCALHMAARKVLAKTQITCSAMNPGHIKASVDG